MWEADIGPKNYVCQLDDTVSQFWIALLGDNDEEYIRLIA